MLLTLKNEANKFRYVIPAPERYRKVRLLSRDDFFKLYRLFQMIHRLLMLFKSGWVGNIGV